MRRWFSVIAFGLLVGTASQAQVLNEYTSKLVSVGLPCSGSSTSRFARVGQWCPITVQLDLLETSPREVALRVETRDLDGDRIKYSSEPIALNPRMTSTYTTYAVISTSSQTELVVEVADLDSGEVLKKWDVGAYSLGILPNDTMFILDLEGTGRSQSGTKLVGMVDDNLGFADSGEGQRKFYRVVESGRMPISELPDRWFGLEAVDVIVWNVPDTRTNAIDTKKLRAIVDWVRNGGQLVVGIGKNADLIQACRDLHEILPFELSGKTELVQELPQFERNYVRPDQRKASPRTVAEATLRSGAVEVLYDNVGGQSRHPIVSMWNVGAGQVIASTVDLDELFPKRVKATHVSFDPSWGLVFKLLNLNPTTPKYLADETNTMMSMTSLEMAKPVAPSIVSVVGFGAKGGAYALIATFFVLAYIVLAALISWFWLKGKKKTSLSWPVFAGLAGIASVLSLAAVEAKQGILGTVYSLCVVDAESGGSNVVSKCWFGYQSPDRADRDFSLPTVEGETIDASGNFLRPMTPPSSDGAFYVTTDTYTDDIRQGVLRDTPSRASLKQFEGAWRGTVDGSVDGEIVVSRRNGRVQSSSWISNRFGGLDFEDGYLLYVDPRQGVKAAERAAGLTTSHRSEFRGVVPPAANVLVLELDEITAGNRVQNIGLRAYGKVDEAIAKWKGSTSKRKKPETKPDLYTLRQYQNDDWRGVGDFQEAIMMASTRDLFLTGNRAGRWHEFDVSSNKKVTTQFMTDLDITHWLVRGQAVVVLFADQPGPANLYRDGEEFKSSKGKTVYRVRVPVRYVN